MADRYLNESGGTNGFTLEDGTGVLLLEEGSADVFIIGLARIETGVTAVTAAALGGVIQE